MAVNPPPPVVGAAPTVGAGWYPDPFARYEHRYFNGTSWTGDVSTSGQRAVDPLGGGADRSGSALAAMICGIVAILIGWVPIIAVLGVVLAITAIVLGVRARRRTSDGRATTGMVTGIVGLVLSVLGLVLTLVVVRAVMQFIEPADHDIAMTSCTVEDDMAVVRGTLTNLGDTTATFTVFILADGEFDTTEIRRVAPGQAAEWSTMIRPASCDPTVVVHGPLPFGMPMDPMP